MKIIKPKITNTLIVTLKLKSYENKNLCIEPDADGCCFIQL